jgi:DNA replication protein DnaC
MKFTLSTNIKNVGYNDFQYIVTSNSKRVLGSIVADYNSGIHCFTLVGTYGTGKSSFLAALERDLLQNTNVLIKKQGLFNGYKKFVTLNIVGDYNSFSNLLSEELSSNGNNSKEFFTKLENKVKKHKDNNEFLLLVIDEFGKILEHAANNNPERELYFLQQLAEFVNSSKHDNILLLTTLHQSFGAYSKKLTEQQRNEWEKVKGRFKEIVFSEPVEQLLHLAATQIEKSSKKIISEKNFETLFNLAKQTKFINNDLDISVAEKLYPIDIFSAVVLTQSIQRYGQNERSLFSFLSSKDNNSINNFEPTATLTYSFSNVYDYIIYNFYSYLSEVNADSANWRALRVALERVEGFLAIEKVGNASKIVKTIGLCNLFENSINFSENSLSQYAKLALGIENPLAKYKSQYIISINQIFFEYDIAA